MAGACPAFRAHGPVLASELSASERERLRTAINDRGIDYVGQELVRLSTTPVWDQGRITPRPFVLRVFAAATPAWLDHHARRLLPDRRAARRARGVDGRWRARGRRLGGFRQGGVGRRRCCRRPIRVRIRRIAGVGAEPGRRQSVLARPLSGARRGDAAAGAGARHAQRDPGKGSLNRAALGRADPAAAGDLGRDLAGVARRSRPRSSPRRCKARTSSARRCRWCARRSAPRRRCASGCRRMPGRSSPR